MVSTACWIYGKKCTYSLFIFLKQFGEIEDCQIDENNLNAVITYKSRAEAEQVSSLWFTHSVYLQLSLKVVNRENIHLVFLHKKCYPLHCLLFSLSLFLPSKRRLFTVWGSKTRLCAWRGTRPPWLSVQPMLMRESQRRTRFVDLQHIVINCRQKVER